MIRRIKNKFIRRAVLIAISPIFPLLVIVAYVLEAAELFPEVYKDFVDVVKNAWRGV